MKQTRELKAVNFGDAVNFSFFQTLANGNFLSRAITLSTCRGDFMLSYKSKNQNLSNELI